MSIELRIATKADAASLAALGMQVWLDTYAIEGLRDALARYVLSTFTVANFERSMADKHRRLLVAEQDGHLLAYAQVALRAPCPSAPAVSVELETLYVLPAFKGRGLGIRLLSAAQALSNAGLWLRVWYRNEAAIAFYHRAGAELIGRTVFELDGEQHENLILAWA